MSKLLGLAALAVVLGACSTTAPPPPQVASIEGGSAAPTTSATSVAGRPQWRLDSTDEEVKKLWFAYYACLGEHGHKMIPERGSPDQNSHTPQDKAAEDACLHTMPLEPDELDKSKNPHFLDDYHVYMKCLTDKGMRVHAIDPFGTGWTFDDGVTQTLSNDQQIKVEHDCQAQSFANH
ncbi:hypothetical protein [Kutzneria chonburiensis]|uniref:Secreted protein n=1 Tax=Kutzneria chonburiensis TaxID=1483604 RepID=A0ABV6MIS1_9PSEU|nr:hypothetical protein [Kutzneria chonburiensis]